MRVEKFLTVIFIQNSKHGTIPHIVAVDNGIAVCKIILIFIIRKQAAGLVVGTIVKVVQIVIVVVSLRTFIRISSNILIIALFLNKDGILFSIHKAMISMWK